jgi:hypothetical protein
MGGETDRHDNHAQAGSAQTPTTISLFSSSLSLSFFHYTYTSTISFHTQLSIIITKATIKIMVKRPPSSQSTCSSEYELKPDIESDDENENNEKVKSRPPTKKSEG